MFPAKSKQTSKVPVLIAVELQQQVLLQINLLSKLAILKNKTFNKKRLVQKPAFFILSPEDSMESITVDLGDH
jgi:hypothetical protein